MRRIAPLLLVLCVAALWPQDSADLIPDELTTVSSLADLDLTSATLHQAGPAAFYLRSVGIDGGSYSLLFEAGSDGSWSLVSLNAESDNLLPSETILDFATISAVDADTLVIAGVIVGSQIYSGTLDVGTDASLSLSGEIAASSASSLNEARAASLEALVGVESGEFDDAVAEQLENLQERVAALEAERDAAEAERDELLAERDSLTEQLATLRDLSVESSDTADETSELTEASNTLSDQIAELQDENQQLQDEVANMTSEVGRLTGLVDAYRSASENDPAVADASSDESTGTSDEPGPFMPGDYVTRSDLDAAAAAVTAELRSLDTRIGALETAASNLASLEEAIRASNSLSVTGAPAADGLAAGTDGATSTDGATEADARSALAASEESERIAEITAELAELIRENDQLRQEKETLEERILDDILSRGFVSLMRDRLTTVVRSGFSESVQDMGAWSVTTGSAIQGDPNQYFAKLAIDATQGSAPVLYSFRARSLDPSGWVGVGLHLFVEDVEKRRGYGMGKSLLVWLTRDPDVYKTNLTYLQLYRSDDDINMGRVLDSIIPEPVSEFLDIEVLYEPETEYLTIAVNGIDKIRYQTWFGITSGVEVALRSLGRAEFRDLVITTAP